MHQLRPLYVAALGLFSCLTLHADVSQIFVVRLNLSKQLPPALVEKMAKEMSATTDSLGFEVKIKGSRALVRMGSFISYSDFDGALVTVVDRPSKRFSTVSPQEYHRAWRAWEDGVRKAVASASPNGAAPGISMKPESKIHATGKTRKIQGIETEEYQFTVAAPLSNTESMRLRISLWCPVQQERVHNPALIELQRYSDRAYVSPDFLKDMTKSVDTAAPGFTALVEEMKRVEPYLEMRVGFSLPGMGAEDGEPAFEMVQELIEFSTEPLSDALFAPPRNFAPASIDELLPVVMEQGMKQLPGARDVKAPVMRPGTEDASPDPDRPKLQRKKR